ncbi:MAG: hypothetical protein AAF631_14200 [Pseudomonadota bacterium]
MATQNSPGSSAPSWTLASWILGQFSVLIAFAYIMGWYFLFAVPLLALFAVVAFVASFFDLGSSDPIGFASLVLSPLSFAFLIWQFFGFVGPAYIDIVRAVGILTQRAHQLTPTKALALVKARRLAATNFVLKPFQRLK